MRAQYQALMDEHNEAHEEEDRQMWELETGIQRLGLKGKGGRKPRWRYTTKTGKQERKGKGGIDWIRYQQEVLLPRFLPFLKKLREKYGPVHIVQEDNCASHVSRWNRQIWEEAGFKVLDWPSNSPDLTAIEPPWARIKQSFRRRKVPKSRVELERDWSKQWRNYPQEKLQRYVERIQGNIKWVIRLAGGNNYKEGTIPPPLPPGEEEPVVRVWREWIKKTEAQKQAELVDMPGDNDILEWLDDADGEVGGDAAGDAAGDASVGASISLNRKRSSIWIRTVTGPLGQQEVFKRFWPRPPYCVQFLTKQTWPSPGSKETKRNPRGSPAMVSTPSTVELATGQATLQIGPWTRRKPAGR